MRQKILTFILVYRKNKVFKDWVPKDIVKYINKHISTGTIYVTTSGEQVVGLVTFKIKDKDEKIVEVEDILTSKPNRRALSSFANRFIESHGKGWRVIGDYCKGFRNHNLDNLARIA